MFAKRIVVTFLKSFFFNENFVFHDNVHPNAVNRYRKFCWDQIEYVYTVRTFNNRMVKILLGSNKICLYRTYV